ncbi:carbohydrate ABC transporter permease [Paenibacillus oryzisoli]|uniref:ABC transporter permease n=1 Tax=Paenibacillus oryzisoli TaxID=1850517 RepID=A0A198AM81_9BACL|nr:sugar ABC transporter permease [Paenibacillus oryzisoli]OAS22111.1 ABC transporter permease [Paenibacillus oryzisoli]
MSKTVARSDFENKAGYLFILPWIIGFLAFTLVPLLCLIYFSFTRYDLLSSPKWLGLDNYIEILTHDPKFIQSLKVTFIYVLIAIPARLIVALAIAMLLNTKHRFIGVYRTVFYIPSIIGGSVAVAVMWRLLFSREGAVNSLIGYLFGKTPDISWVGDPSTALGSIILLSMWQFGSPMVIFLAGLKNIPASYYEAAVVDGANGWQRFLRITLPLLSPVLFFNLIMQIIGGFMTFTQGLIITGGGPLDKTLFYQLYVYRRGFELFEMGYASALSCILLVIVAILTAIVFKTSNSWVHYESKGE